MKRQLIIVTALTLIAGWLRFTAISFGMPGTYRPDEQYMIYPAVDFVDDWNPHFAIYPAAQMYVQHAALYAYASLRGHASNFRSMYQSDQLALAYLVARWVSAAFGVATVPAIYFAVAPFGTVAALAAAAILTFSPLHVLHSKFATTDVPAVFWLTLAIAMVLGIANHGRFRYYFFAGLFSGLATATKYPAGVIVFGILSAHFEWRRRSGRSFFGSFVDAKIWLAAAVTLFAFFCATPYFFLDWAHTLHDLTYQGGYFFSGYSAAGYGWRWVFLRSMPTCYGVAVEALMLAGVIWSLLTRRPGTLSLLAYLGITLVILFFSDILFYRYILVLLPGMALLSGVFVADLITCAATQPRQGRLTALAIGGFAVLLTPSLMRDIQLDRLLLKTDTRQLARQWIVKKIPMGTKIAEIDDTTPCGKPVLQDVYQIVPFQSPDLLRAKGITWVYSDSYPPLAMYSRGPSPQELVELDSAATLVFDSDPFIDGALEPIYDPNDAFYAPLEHISSVARPGPRVRIWRIK